MSVLALLTLSVVAVSCTSPSSEETQLSPTATQSNLLTAAEASQPGPDAVNRQTADVVVDRPERWWNANVLILIPLLIDLEVEVLTAYQLIDANKEGIPRHWPIAAEAADLLTLARQRLAYSRRAWSDSAPHRWLFGPNDDPQFRDLDRELDAAYREVERYILDVGKASESGERRPEPVSPQKVIALIGRVHDLLAEDHFDQMSSARIGTTEKDWALLFALDGYGRWLDEMCHVTSCVGYPSSIIGGDETSGPRRQYATYALSHIVAVMSDRGGEDDPVTVRDYIRSNAAHEMQQRAYERKRNLRGYPELGVHLGYDFHLRATNALFLYRWLVVDAILSEAEG